MTIKTSLKIIAGTSILMFAGATSAYADHHKSGEYDKATKAQMKDKMKKMTDEEKAAMHEKMKDMTDEEKAAMHEKMGHKKKHMKEAGEHKMKAKEHKMEAKERAMEAKEHKMEAKEHKMEAMEHKMEAKERAMEAKEHKMEAMEAKQDRMDMKVDAEHGKAAMAPGIQKQLSFDEALAVCRADANANLQACIDERTGQGALRKQIHGRMTN